MGAKLKYFTFVQNNSGGTFQGPAPYVIIEAENAEHANELAEENGLYFDGCSDGRDCNCCGDRWRRTYETEGKDEPLIYGQTPGKEAKDFVIFPFEKS